MQTNDPKAMAIWVAWQMIEKLGVGTATSGGTNEEKVERLRKVFQDNYKAIAEVAELEPKTTAARG